MKIVTVSREFGSGGREVGKRLADALGVAYYDREILTAIAEDAKLDESYVENVLEMCNPANPSYHLTFSRTFSYNPMSGNAAQLLARQHRIIRALAEKGDCVIVGRGAEAVLAEYRPFRIFVHADMSARLARCRSRAAAGEQLSDRELQRQIRQIDKTRAANHSFVSDIPWGAREGYELCLNTTHMDIKKTVPLLTQLIGQWFQENGQ